MSVGDLEGMAVIKLARLHEHLAEDDDAATQYNRYVEQTEVVGVMSVADLCSAYVFLARYNLKKRNLEAAEMYAHKCCEFNEFGFLRVEKRAKDCFAKFPTAGLVEMVPERVQMPSPKNYHLQI